MENEMKCEPELLNFQSLIEMVENNYSGFSSGNDSFYKMLDDGIRLLATMRIEDSLANDVKLYRQIV